MKSTNTLSRYSWKKLILRRSWPHLSIHDVYVFVASFAAAPELLIRQGEREGIASVAPKKKFMQKR